MHGADDLHVSLRDILHPNSPMGVTHITFPHAMLKKEKNLELVTVLTELVRSSH